LHHRLLEIGHSQRKAVLIMYAWAGALAAGATAAAFAGLHVGILIGVGLLLLAVVVTRPVRAIRAARAGH
jgi:UDP-GlcNAc:undecaprenyl-phosphate GlcNAc-1-phosphate transferase